MPIKFRCPTCEHMLSIAKRKAGTRVICPRCEDDVSVPDEPAVDLADELEDEETKPSKPVPVSKIPIDRPQESPAFEKVDLDEVLGDIRPPSTLAPVSSRPLPKPKAKPKTPEKSKEPPLFEKVDLDEVLGPSGTPPVIAPRPEPAAIPTVETENGFLISRGTAAILGVLFVILMAMSFATGYLIGK